MAFTDILNKVPKKYRVLIIFCFFTLNNGFAWLMFDPVAGWLEENVKGLGRTQLELLSSWQPIVFLCMCIPIMKLVTRYDGLRTAVRLGATAEIFGAVFKLIGASARKSYAGLVFLNIGQIFSGIGSPVATGCVSALSALWFEPEERTRATAAAVLFNSVGNSVCYLLVPIMTTNLTFVAVTVYELAVGLAAVALAWVVFPQEPLVASAVQVSPTLKSKGLVQDGDNDATGFDASKTGGGEETGEHAKAHASLRSQLFGLIKMPSIIFLFLTYAWLSGGFSAWVSLFAATYNKFYGEGFIGIMSFFGMISFVAGGLASSYVVDLYFARQMKYVIFFCITMNAVSNLIFIAATPNDKGFCLWNLGKGFIVFSTALCGFWNGAAAPLFYELVAEISYPVEEGVSGICVSICENLGALLFYQIVSKFFRGQSMSVAYSFGMTIALALCAAVRQRYNRTYHAYLVENNQIVNLLCWILYVSKRKEEVGSGGVYAYVVFVSIGLFVFLLISSPLIYWPYAYGSEMSPMARRNAFGLGIVFCFFAHDLPMSWVKLWLVWYFGWKEIFEGISMFLTLFCFCIGFLVTWISYTWKISKVLQIRFGDAAPSHATVSAAAASKVAGALRI